MEFVIWSLIVIVITGILASHKGRNVGGWCLLSLLFGIIPTIILAFLPSLRGGRKYVGKY